MKFDCAEVKKSDLKSYDVCIVGGGAVGYAMANRLKDSGKEVVVLESGINNVRKGTNYNWDQHPRFWDANQEVRDLDNGVQGNFVSSVSRNFLTESRTRCLGGSTNCWGGWIRPLDSYDFDGWPIQKSDLDPYYVDALPLVDLSHFDIFDQPLKWQGIVETEIKPFDAAKMKEYGLRTVVIQQQSSTYLIDFQEQFADIFDQHENLTLITNFNALKLELQQGEPAKVSGVYGRPLVEKDGSLVPGEPLLIEASQIVLAMGGLEVTRFLLLNGFDKAPMSLGDIGKYYMNHPKYITAAYPNLPADHTLAPDSGPEANFYKRLVSVKSGRGGAHIQAYVVPEEETLKKYGTRNYRTALNWEVRQVPGHSYKLQYVNIEINFEQAPNEKSTISLHPTKTDIFGQPLIDLDMRFVSQDADTLNNSMKPMFSWLNSFGPLGNDRNQTTWNYASDPFPPSKDSRGGDIYLGDHHMGTLRMGDGSFGVVNEKLKVRATENLFVCSTAVYPTGGWANATLTLLALALRLADDFGMA